MTKLLLLAVLVWLVVRLRPGLRRPAAAAVDPLDGLSPDPSRPLTREMVRDDVCSTFVSRAEALTTVGAGKVHYFCSSACYRAFLAGRSAARAAEA